MEVNEGKLIKKRQRAEAVAEFNELTKELKEICQNDESAVRIQDLIRANLNRSSELYPIVKKKLDGTFADSRHMRELINLCHEAAKRINATAKPFELGVIIKNLMKNAEENEGRKLTLQEFTRIITQKHVNSFLLNPPTFEFFYGALRSEDLPIREKKRKIREKLVETKAVTAKERNIEVDVEEDSTPKEVEHISRQITRLSRDSRSNRQAETPFFEALVDPHSFTQTVENIFHVSFLVKEGKFGIKPDAAKKAMLTVEDANSNPNREEDTRAGDEGPQASGSGKNGGKQSILSFSMEDYKNWITTFKIKERAFAPRNDLDT